MLCKFKAVFILLVSISFCSGSIQIENGIETSNVYYALTQVKPIELQAVGRVARLGELYDARSDQFLHLSLIKSNLPNTLTVSTQNKQTRLKYSLINSLEEKFRTLDIQAELKLSIMGGLFDLEGSGKFFKDTKRSAKSAKASLVSSFSTEYEQMSITSTEVRNLIDLNALEQIDATHVVVGIQWGGNVFISVEDTNYNDQDQQTIEGNLNAKLQMLVTQISGMAQVKINEKERNELSKYNFEIYGDILPQTIPQTLVDAVIFMKSAPKMLLEGNKGKGKAMKYSLIPINLLRQLFKINAKINAISNKIDKATVDSCTKLFDDMNMVEQKFNDILDDLKIYEKYISTKRSNEFRSLFQNYKVFQSEVERNLSEHLILTRSGKETIDKLRNVLTQAYKHPYSYGNINFEKFSSLKREFKFIKLLIQLSVHILDKETSMQEYLSLNFNKDIYTFFYKDEFPTFSDKPMMTFRNILEKKQTFGPNSIFTAIKIDVLNEIEKKIYFNFNGSPSKLSVYRNGQRIIDNYVVNTIIPPNNKPELWSFYYMQTVVSTLKNQVTALMHNPAPIPIGFIYVQLAGQADPHSLWPSTQWNNETPKYAGLFFRAEGRGSNGFGQIQEQQTQSIDIKGVDCLNGGCLASNQLNHRITDKFITPKGILTGVLYQLTMRGLYIPVSMGINFKHNNEELRPRNQAIRIWKRIK